jgi:hypothetical protein
MPDFNTAEAFKKIRAKNQHLKETAEELAREKRAEYDAYAQRQTAIHQLMALFPSEAVPPRHSSRTISKSPRRLPTRPDISEELW